MNPFFHIFFFKKLLCICIFVSGIAQIPVITKASETTSTSHDLTRPNILFIFADDWGWGDLSCHGHESFKTPNLDRLTEEGIEFTQFTVANPVCSPSRTALMTGHFPARHHIHRHFWNVEKNREFGMPDWLDPELVMLPRLFKEAGYRTGHFGKWHLCGRGYGGPPEPKAYGYDESAIYGGPGPKANPANSSTFNKTIDFIRANQDKSFFVNMWIHETHTPHFPKKKFLKDFADLDERHQVYAAIVAEADHGIGRVLDVLEELGLTENTLVVFSSDNGPEQPAKSERQKKMHDGSGLGLYYSVGSTGGLKGRKRSLYEGGICVPFIVRWPGKTPEGTSNETTTITAVDMLPTLCAAAGITLPEAYQPDGENMLDAFLGDDIQRTKPIFWEWTGPAFVGWAFDTTIKINWARLGVRHESWKLLMNYNGEKSELYKMPDDRDENKDLSDKYPEVVSNLSSMLLKWKKELPKNVATNCISSDRAVTSELKK